MLYLVYELERSPLGSFEETIDCGPPSSRLALNTNSYDYVFEALKGKPLLVPIWTVTVSQYLSPDKLLKFIKEYENTDNIFIVKCTSKTRFTDLVNMFVSENVESVQVDNSVIDKSYLEEYVKISINYVEDNIPKDLCKRVRYNTNKLVEAVDLLSTLDVVTSTELKRYVSTSSIASYYDITLSILGVPTSTPLSGVLNIMSQYMFGYKSIFKSIKKDLEEFLLVFRYIESGELSMENLEDFQPDDKEFRRISKYKKTKIIHSYKYLSLDKLYFTKSIIDMTPVSYNHYYKLINMVSQNHNKIKRGKLWK